MALNTKMSVRIQRDNDRKGLGRCQKLGRAQGIVPTVTDLMTVVEILSTR